MATNYGRKQKAYFDALEYKMIYWEYFDYAVFDHIVIRKKHGMGKKTYGDIIIMADTETSKSHDHDKIHDNHVVCWTLSARAFHNNIVTLYGRKPSDFPKMLLRIKEHIPADELSVYFHNLSYDHTFLRRFMYKELGTPTDQLNVKPLYPIYIKFGCGIILKDSLILAQRTLDKWAKDLDISDKKAMGLWDYELIRDQDTPLSANELCYIEHDTLAGVECIDKTMEVLGKNISSIPLTSTGIVRGDCRALGKQNKCRDNWFLKIQPQEYDMQLLFEILFNGGYVHANRYYKYDIMTAICYDISSSYPFRALADKFPSEKFWKWDNNGKPITPEIIFKNSDYACIMKVSATNVRLKNPRDPMPMLSMAKSHIANNTVLDNGRILNADYIEIYYTEIDLKIFCEQYDYDYIGITDVYVSFKDYLPRWFRDYVFERFVLKTKLKGVDPVLYQIEKGKLNACAFGMLAQHPVKKDIKELYENVIIDGQEFKAGQYIIDNDFDPQKEYEKFLKSYSSFLPYPIAPYITAYSRLALRELGKCVIGIYLYSDTDSVYGTEFDPVKLKAYNDDCIRRLNEAGYGGVEFNGRTYYLGVAEFDGDYSEFSALHAKCYCKRERESGELIITIAGVPKENGAKCLNDDINNFKPGFCFSGSDTGKLQHEHICVDDIYIDEYGNECGDSIDLTPCDYIVGDANVPELEDILNAEVNIIDYEI